VSSSTISVPDQPNDMYAEDFIVKAYSAGVNSNQICYGLTDEVYGVQWQLSKSVPFSKKGFEEQVTNCDLLVIVADLSDECELENSYLMASIGEVLGILVLIFTTNRLNEDSDDICSSSIKQSQLFKITSAFQIHEERLSPSVFPNKNYKALTINLLWKLKAIVEIVSLQSVIGVDYSDIRCCLNHKGICQSFFGVGQGGDTVSKAITDLNRKLSSELLSNAKGVIITLFTGLDIHIAGIEKIYDDVMIMKVNREDSLVVFGVVVEPELNDAKAISIMVSF